MNAKTKTSLAFLLNGMAYLLFVIACIAFWWGGGLIHRIVGTDRMFAEAEGLGFAFLFAGISAFLKSVATRLETGDGMISLSDALRK